MPGASTAYVILLYGTAQKLANSRCRAYYPAVAGHLLVNSARKTNIAFGAACFSFALITLYHVLGEEGKAWGKE